MLEMLSDRAVVDLFRYPAADGMGKKMYVSSPTTSTHEIRVVRQFNPLLPLATAARGCCSYLRRVSLSTRESAE